MQAVGWLLFPALMLPVLVLVTDRTHALATTVADTLDPINRAIGEAAKWLLPVLVLSVVWTVFALSIFGMASTKLDESAIYLHATVLMLGSAAALLADAHVRVDIFHSGLGPDARARVEICGFYLLLAPLMLIILWMSQSQVAFSWAVLEGSADADGIRGQFLLKTLIPAFALLMLAQGLAIATRAALRLAGVRNGA